MLCWSNLDVRRIRNEDACERVDDGYSSDMVLMNTGSVERSCGQPEPFQYRENDRVQGRSYAAMPIQAFRVKLRGQALLQALNKNPDRADQNGGRERRVRCWVSEAPACHPQARYVP
jgi:hypothetical protein